LVSIRIFIQAIVQGYFAESPFFDHTTKNGVLWGQALNDSNTLALYSDRQRLEQTIRSRPGTEYVVVGEPQPSNDPSQEADTGVWVVRKQDRVKRHPKEDDLTTLGTYYLTGNNVYQAPSVYDVVSNHLLSAMTSLGKFMDEIAPIPVYNPATGHSWTQAKTSGDFNGLDTSEVNVAPSVTQDDGMLIDPPSVTAPQDTGTEDEQPITKGTTEQDTSRLMQHALHQVMLYGDEFMDQNPLKGEPGNLHFTYTKEHFRSLQAQAEAAANKAKERQVKDEEEVVEREEARKKAKAALAAVPAAFSTRSSGVLGGDAMVKRKGSRADAKRRRKSRAVLGNSISAMASTVASPIGGQTPDPS